MARMSAAAKTWTVSRSGSSLVGASDGGCIVSAGWLLICRQYQESGSGARVSKLDPIQCVLALDQRLAAWSTSPAINRPADYFPAPA